MTMPCLYQPSKQVKILSMTFQVYDNPSKMVYDNHSSIEKWFMIILISPIKMFMLILHFVIYDNPLVLQVRGLIQFSSCSFQDYHLIYKLSTLSPLIKDKKFNSAVPGQALAFYFSKGPSLYYVSQCLDFFGPPTPFVEWIIKNPIFSLIKS